MVGKIFAKSFCILVITSLLTASATPAYAQFGEGSTSGSGGGITNPLGGKDQTITDILVKVVNWMLGLVGIVALIALITGGARMIMDFGNEEQVHKGKTTILWAVIGLLVVILSYAIINIVTKEILGGSNSSSLTPQQRYDNSL